MCLFQTIRRALLCNMLRVEREGELYLPNTSCSPWLFSIGLQSSLYKPKTFSGGLWWDMSLQWAVPGLLVTWCFVHLPLLISRFFLIFHLYRCGLSSSGNHVIGVLIGTHWRKEAENSASLNGRRDRAWRHSGQLSVEPVFHWDTWHESRNKKYHLL